MIFLIENFFTDWLRCWLIKIIVVVAFLFWTIRELVIDCLREWWLSVELGRDSWLVDESTIRCLIVSSNDDDERWQQALWENWINEMFIYVEAARNNHKKAEQIDDCDDGVSVLWKKYLFFIRLTKFRRIRLVYGCRWSCSSIVKLAQILCKNSISVNTNIMAILSHSDEGSRTEHRE